MYEAQRDGKAFVNKMKNKKPDHLVRCGGARLWEAPSGAIVQDQPALYSETASPSPAQSLVFSNSWPLWTWSLVSAHADEDSGSGEVQKLSLG